MVNDTEPFHGMSMAQIMPVPDGPSGETIQDEPDLLIIGYLVIMVPIFNSQKDAALFGLPVQPIQAEKDALQVGAPSFAALFELSFEEISSFRSFQAPVIKKVLQALVLRFHIYLSQMENYSGRPQIMCTFDGVNGHADCQLSFFAVQGGKKEPIAAAC